MGPNDKQHLTRRQAVLAGLGTLVLGGCASGGSRYGSGRPTAWDTYPAPPVARRYGYTEVRPTHPAQPDPRTPTTQPAIGGIGAISRSNWTRENPIRSKVNNMSGINKITIHHEGWKVVDFSDASTTKDRIETIRAVHVRDRGWGDIGYHFIIDRAGRVWEGRPIQYQGAHVSQNNEHNVGILVLGNFEKQSPSNAQLQSLFNTTAKLKNTHRVQKAMVRSHQEIRATSCPGRNLQRSMDALRRHVG